jgi:hypothetical protein
VNARSIATVSVIVNCSPGCTLLGVGVPKLMTSRPGRSFTVTGAGAVWSITSSLVRSEVAA